MKPKVIIFCGLPFCGKETLALFCRSVNPTQVYIVSKEWIRKRITGDKFDFSKEEQVKNDIAQEIKWSLKHNYITLIVGTNISKNSRKELLEYIGDRADVYCCWLQSDLIECMTANSKKDDPLPASFLRTIYNLMDRVDMKEGFKEIFYLNPKYDIAISSYNYKPKKVFDLLKELVS